MANRTHFLQYYIHLTDKAAYDAARASVAASADWLLNQAPDDVAATYGAVIVTPNPLQRFDPPCITSGYFAESFNYPRNVAQFTRKSGGWFGISSLFGDTHTYKWVGFFQYAGTENNETEVPSEPTPVAMAQRRWVDGFEQGYGSGAMGGNGADYGSPAASRHVGGFGFAARNGQGIFIDHRIVESGAAVDTKGWDRFYVRLRNAPNSSQTFWQMVGAISAGAGARLRFGVGGTIEIVNSDNLGTLYGLGATSALVIDRWYKIDCLYRYGVAPDGFFKMYLNGVEAFSVSSNSLPAGTGITQAQNCTGTRISDGNSLTHGGSWDVDDWIGSELPAGGANPALFPARDWNSGSKVVGITGKAAAATNTGNWAGPGGANANDWRLTTQRPHTSSSNQTLTTSTASQRLAVVTDADRRIDLDPLNRGAAAVTVGVSSFKTAGAGADCLVGLRLPGAGEVTAVPVVPEPSIFTTGIGRLLYSANAVEPLSPMNGTEISFTGSTVATLKSLFNLWGQVECIGIFHPEDYVPQTGDPAGFETGVSHWNNTAHHHRYYDGPWAIPGSGVPSIVVIHARTYVGNGTSQQIAFRTPPSFVFIRNTSTNEHVFWMAGAPAAFSNGDISFRGSNITRVFIDPNFTAAAEDDQSQQTLLEVAGNSPNVNANGTTYEIIAFCDPGQRFSEVGALAETAGSTNARTTLFNNTGLLPEWMMLFRNQSGNASTRGLVVKGLGAAATEVYRCNAALLTNALTFAEGSLTTPAASTLYVGSQIQDTFTVFRRDDDSGDAGVVNIVQIATWIGDGTASRTVTLSPASGRRPMWALVMGSNGATRQRDATHTSTNSTNLAANTTVVDGITAGGVDSISVGSALNTAAVVYEAIVFPSCNATAGANGWGLDCENIPVEPLTPPTTIPPTEPTEPIEPIDPCGTPGIIPTGTITQCAGPSTLVINTALGQIGVTKQLVAATLNTEVSQEATVCRLHFDEDVRKCLRDFPWPFATRYLKLTAIGGPASRQNIVQAYSATTAYTTGMVVRVSGIDYYALQASTGQAVTNPVYWTTEEPLEFNGDWTYAYLAPTDMMLARRVVDADKRRRSWDLEPPTFRVGSWGNNAIIYSNEENIELEYTHLSGCVAYQGDPLFRSALSWRHAHSIAPALSRDAKLTAFCWEMYQRLLRDARTSGATEQQQDREGDVDWIMGR